MAEQRGRPYGNANFLVDLGDGTDVHASAAGFAEVVFPPFVVGAKHQGGEHAAAAAGASDAQAAGSHDRLILKRGVTGALNLYTWWHKARRRRA